jgi:hypothetical protein
VALKLAIVTVVGGREIKACFPLIGGAKQKRKGKSGRATVPT